MNLPQRKNIRLNNYDYSHNGAYFITICTMDRRIIFGSIENDNMIFSPCGRIAEDEIIATNKLRADAGIKIKHYIVMPNHVHMIVEITGRHYSNEDAVGTRRAVSADAIKQLNGNNRNHEQFAVPTIQSIPTVIRSYKSAVTNGIHKLYGHGTPCPYGVWQSRFHDHIIRNEEEYRMICEYIHSNPARWNDDCFNNKS